MGIPSKRLIDDILSDNDEKILYSEKIPEEEREIRTQKVSAIFRTKKIISTGGMGLVYIVTSNLNVYAIKTLRTNIAETEERMKEVYDRFLWESNVWIALGKHRNIVQAHFCDYDQAHRPIIVMEFIEGHPEYGTSLYDCLKLSKTLPLKKVFKLIIDVLTGLLHAQRVMKDEMNMEFVHRDIKPANILISGDWTAKVTDFGLVSSHALAGTEIELKSNQGRIAFISNGNFCGTPKYMAPEQWKNENLDERTDIYGLGCVMYELLFGKPLFNYSSWKDYKKAHLFEKPLIPDDRDEIPDEIKLLVLRCLSKCRDKRPSLSELREELQRIHKNLYGNIVPVKDQAEELTYADWTNRGSGYDYLCLYDKAVACHTKAIELNPDFAHAYNNRGNAYYYLKDYKKAIEDFNKAIKLNPGYFFAYKNRGNAYRALKRYKDTIADYRKFIELAHLRYPEQVDELKMIIEELEKSKRV